MGDILETAIPILGGLYGCLIGYRVIGNGHKFEGPLRVLGPLVMLFGIITLLVALGRHYL